jgi:putative ABC transport system substrate-binding protein
MPASVGNRERHAGTLGSLRIAAAAGAGMLLLAVSACSSSGSGTTAQSGPAGGAGSGSSASNSPVHIGILQIVQANVLDSTVQAFEAELKAKLAPRPVSFDLKNAEGQQSLVTSLASTFASSGDTGFAAIGTDAVIALAQQVKDKPVIAIAMTDPVGAKVAASMDTPGGNVTGSTDYIDPAILLQQIMTISPAPKRIGTIFTPSDQNMQVWVKALKAAASRYPGLSIVEAPVTGTAGVPAAALSLAGRVDAELIGPDTAAFGALPAIGATAKSNKIPVYLIGGDATTPGILASVGPDYPTVGRLAADAAAEVFAGTPAGRVPFSKPSGVEFDVNKATMTALGTALPTAILRTATVQ